MDKQNRSVLQIALMILGLAAWGNAGLILGNSVDYNQTAIQGHAAGGMAMSPAVAMAPNTKAGLGALGFAIAGGMCLLGAAVAELARTPAGKESTASKLAG